MSIRRFANQSHVLGLMRKDITKRGSQKALAAAIGISAPYLSDVLKGNREPGKSILRFYGLREESVYVKDVPAETAS